MGRQRSGRSTALEPQLRQQIERALAANAIPRAAKLANAALDRGASDPLVFNLVAWRREEAGDYAGAHDLLRRALLLSPGDPLILAAIGTVLRKEGAYDEALAMLDRAAAAAPLHAPIWLERGYAHDGLRSWSEARDSYRRAIELDPMLAPAIAKLADIAAKDGDAETGRAFAARALDLDPAEPTAICALATIDLERRDGATAEARLVALLKGQVKGDDLTRALTLLGDSLDRQDRTGEAFAAFSSAQQNFRRIYAHDLAPRADRPSHRAFIDAITAQLDTMSAGSWRHPTAAVPGAAATHVFLLGYPRSGTTLVENVLASAPGVVALEERDTLLDVDEALVANDGTMPPLDDLPPATIERLRAAYWQRVAAMAGEVAGKTFIDMNPFNGIKLAIIARLFPDAKILIMRRDPRDIVLSCYRINFTPSTAGWAFSDLAETARHYDALMRLVELARTRLPLAFHEVRYDRLVTDFDSTVRAVADFVGLPWTDDFQRFDRTAQARGVRTASATQVRRGLFDGRGQWRRYADQLAPVLPILAPWVERFGFDA